MNPLVTIALPVYNGAATLKPAVHSILKQSFKNWELIILDDASTDNSLEVIRSFDDPRIRLVEGEANAGLSARLNMAVDLASGRYFARMDQDDVSYPDRIKKQLDYLQTHPEVDLLATSYAVFNDNLEWLGKLSLLQHHHEICRKPWNGFYMPHPTWMGRTEWFKSHRYESYADGAEDQNLLLRSYANSRFACLNEVLLAYRQNERPLKKLLRARSRYVRAAFACSHFRGVNCMPLRVLIAQFAKGFGDIADKLLNIPGLRRTLLPLTDSEKDKLKKIFIELN
ncbi:MAG: glycosyltransferase [Mariprofundaceae bacterium]|nr:glycosyltransferase [Mariprofundaceae bacterium]